MHLKRQPTALQRKVDANNADEREILKNIILRCLSLTIEHNLRVPDDITHANHLAGRLEQQACITVSPSGSLRCCRTSHVFEDVELSFQARE